MSIPKIIHYCWFGGNPMPENEARYVEGWKQMLPGYEFRLWNEKNFNINSTKFTQLAAKAKKWAYISDYVHAYAVYNYGGIALDTDVEVIKPFDNLLDDNTCICGFESEQLIAPGLIFAGEKHSVIAKDFLDFYSCNFTLIPPPKILTRILHRYGVVCNNTSQRFNVVTVFPMEYFCPMSFETGFTHITGNTYSIHHYSASWVSDEGKQSIKARWEFYAKYGKDPYLVSLYKEHTELKHNYNNYINAVSLKLLYKAVVKRTIKKFWGNIL